MNQGNRHNIATNKSRIVFFSWASSWVKMRQCLDGAITQAKGRLNVFKEKQFDEIKIRIDSENNTTDFPDKFGEFYNKYKKGGYPALKAIIVFGDVPNESLVSKCKDNMMGFINENIPIIACICGRQDLAIDGYFHCWCPSINIVARTAAQQSDEVHKSIAKHDHSTFWCLFTNDLAGFGNESAETYKSWLTDAYGFEEGRIKCICINNISDFRPKENDIAFITGFGSDYSKLVKEALKYKTKYKNLFLIFDQSIADPENISGKKEEGTLDSQKLPESSSVQYIDFMPTGATKQLALKNKFAVLPYVAFSLADRISANENAREALRELPFIDVDGETYLISESSTITVPVSLMDAEISNESGSLYECTIDVKNHLRGNFLPSEKLGFLLQGVAKQMVNLSVHSPAKDIETTVSRIEGVFIEALSNCRIAIDVPVIYDGTKSYCSKHKNVADIFHGIRAIGGIYQFKDLIQMSVIADDVAEDNGIARAYFKCANVNFPTPLRFLDDKKATIEQLVFSRNLDYEVKRGSYAFIKSLDDKQRNALVKAVQALKHFSEECNANYVYIIPYPVTESCGGALLIASPCKFTYLNGRIINAISEQIFSSIAGVLKSQALECANVKSAIGSIMSRNGSHNIGSHVLAALSHNVGTMPDDRVLYQYIQQRMDYIATATTDFPAWRQPTMLVSGMMRQFLIQRHLLDHIAGSEGLRAYQFQNRSLEPRQDRTIRIHIRRINDAIANWAKEGFLDSSFSDIRGNLVSFINYGEHNDSYSALKDNKDVAVAIPGGVVGQHAFYTIVENIIRNAAKHDWAKIVKGSSRNSNSECDSGISNGEIFNLELYIDFRDNSKDGLVEFRVWTCVTENNSKVVHSQQDNRDEKFVISEISKKICQCFIDSEGGLRKENWGIAEMRISAGYLRNCDIADIGGLNNYEHLGADNETMKIIRPVEVSLPDGTSAVGYRFDLYKPRELLIVLPEHCDPTDDVLRRANRNANQYGVWIKRETELIKESDLSFSYVLFDTFDVNNEYRLCLPFRVIASKVVANARKLGGEVSGSTHCGGSLDSARRLIAETGFPLFRFFEDAESLSDIQKLAEETNKAKKVCEDLLERLYGVWMAHITKNDHSYLAIDIIGGGGEKKSLVTKVDLLRFVLENSFNAAAKSFLELGYGEYEPNRKAKSDSEISFEKVLRDIISMKPREVTIGKVKDSQAPTDGIAITILLRRQLKEWFGRLYGKTKLVKCRHDEFVSSYGYKEFVKYICGPIIDQAEVFLAKYEEEYSTLPGDFKIKAGKKEGSWPIPILCGMQNVSIEYSNEDTKRRQLYDKGHMCYFRHSPGSAGEIRNYLEPLSGSQSYLGAFIALRESLVNHAVTVNDKRFIASLVENAVMKILIIDERVSDFMDDHAEVSDKLGGLGISVKDDDDPVVANLFDAINADDDVKLDEVMNTSISGVALKDFEILIIHQGIIDKFLNGHEDAEVVNKFLKSLIQRMHYVIVTTGRGSPANIPDEARMLPYSVIKDTLLKCYPEKMILVGAVMNILPVRNQKVTKNKKGN